MRELKLKRINRVEPVEQSHPLRVRELKLFKCLHPVVLEESHPLRVRELKPNFYQGDDKAQSRTLYGCVN